MTSERLNTRLEATGAEFLVLGNLLLRKVEAHKAYTNFPGYDVLAINPLKQKVCRVQVKSRYYSTDKAFDIKNLDSDFVVFVGLDRGNRPKKGSLEIATPASDPKYYIFPTELIKQVRTDSDNPKVRFKRIPEVESYRNNWDLILEYLGI